MQRRRGLVAGIAVAVIAADLATKVWATQVLAAHPVRLVGDDVVLTEGRNAGAAFEVGTSLTPLLAVLAIAAVLAMAYAARRPQALPVAVALGLGIGGAAGNAGDRLFRAPGPLRGHVVDWIDIGSWPTFNLADSALMTAVAVAVVASSRGARDGRALSGHQA
ncbi:signal peptidase II [Motilibacter rhizosphaerae]|uniref:signal peptidase II n=1 Tax=Motilibacter rhizosphaerae TaxID=598652 RepID=UPI0013EEC79F|nr:signal peptidase II [Motilibacter rhizosphaerae]